MKYLLRDLKISINPSIYLKDPESSKLGKRIVQNGILLIEDIGFESFNFKKLGDKIGSNESSIYRYFENKHKFLLYLTSWYWGWKEYQLVLTTTSIENPLTKLKKAIEIITRPVEEDSSFDHINEVALNTIIINENSKIYLTKEVDKENKEGFFIIYKRLVSRLKEMIKQVNSDYAFPASLASTVIEGSLHQHFLKKHFTTITDCDAKTSPTQFYIEMATQLLIP